MAVLLDSHVLDDIWANWMNANSVVHRGTLYSAQWRAHKVCQDFEDWLYEHGAVVIQYHRERKLKFDSELDAAIFAMTHA
jgi:hypothetical protein